MGFSVISMYKSNLVAMLTTPKLPIEYTTVEELTDLYHYKVMVESGSYLHKRLEARIILNAHNY